MNKIFLTSIFTIIMLFGTKPSLADSSYIYFGSLMITLDGQQTLSLKEREKQCKITYDNKDCLSLVNKSQIKIANNSKCSGTKMHISCKNKKPHEVTWDTLFAQYEQDPSKQDNLVIWMKDIDSASDTPVPTATTTHSTKIMLPLDKDGKSEKMDANLFPNSCKMTSTNTKCIQNPNFAKNPIQYEVYSYSDDTICSDAKLKIECDGYKKEELSWYGITKSPWRELTLEKSTNIFKRTGNAISKGASAVGNAAKKGAGAVTGVFKSKKKPCSEEQQKELTDKAENKEQIKETKLDKSGTSCIVSKCEGNYVPNDNNNGCILSKGPCLQEDIDKVEHATAGKIKNNTCHITDCETGFKPTDDGKACEEQPEDETDTETQAENPDDNAPRLSEEDSKAKVDALRDNALKMKEKEQSDANKMLGSAAIGTTAFGGMNLLSGLAEQNADDSAEEDMKAYLATFVCDFGQGRNIRGGETNIDLPGGNELLNYVNEYKALAADLKTRKEALGKAPGIESEVIYDIAETGLYDNVGMGRQSGAYVSVSRALLDPNSEDAARWNEQKQAAHDKKNDGLKTAIAGAAAGLAGNLAINSNNKNQSDRIINEYEKKKQIIRKIQEEIIDILPEQQNPQCSDYTYNGQQLGGTYPNCVCGDKAYFKTDYTDNAGNLVGCIDCLGDTVPNTEKTACVCPNDRTPDANGNCPKDAEPCSFKGNFVDTKNCKCAGEATPNADNTGCDCEASKNNYNNNGVCTHCPDTLDNGRCIKPAPESELPPIVLSEKKTFIKSKAKFVDTASNVLDDLVNSLAEIEDRDQYNVCIEGQADPSDFPRNSKKNNNDLSASRAYIVFDRLKTLPKYKSVKYIGTGAVKTKDTADIVQKTSEQCDPNNKSTFGNCRRVLIRVQTSECGDGYTDDTSQPSFFRLYQ